MRTPQQAVAWGKAHPEGWPGLCLTFVRSAYDVEPQGYDTAAEGWTDTKKRGTGVAPFGALVWWTGGSKGAGHIAISLGGGRCLSTDFGPTRYMGDGKVRDIPIENVARQSSCVYRGWSRDYGGILVLPPAKPKFPPWQVIHGDGSSGIFYPPAPDKSAFDAAWARAKEIAISEYDVRVRRV
jgi:hypothetical protein